MLEPHVNMAFQKTFPLAVLDPHVRHRLAEYKLVVYDFLGLPGGKLPLSHCFESPPTPQSPQSSIPILRFGISNGYFIFLKLTSFQDVFHRR